MQAEGEEIRRSTLYIVYKGGLQAREWKINTGNQTKTLKRERLFEKH
jgi:hypothetical protein